MTSDVNDHTFVDDSYSERLNEVLLAYLEACEAGHSPDRRQLFDTHPDLQEDLSLFFAERDRLTSLGGYSSGRDRHSSGRGFGRRAEFVVPEAINGQLGDFRLISEVGRGGMGVVFEAEQISLNRRVALKILPFASAVDPRHLQRFRNEAAAAAHLRHDNIVSVYAVGCERGVHYFAMQFVEGQSLSALIAARKRVRNPRSLDSTVMMAQRSTDPPSLPGSRFDWVAGIGRQAALALEHAHQAGVVHRDIKPANLMLDTTGHLWVTDFGLAQIASDATLTMTGEMLGTLRYASPEQLQGRRGIVDHRCDIYSLGATLYELLTLRPPFDGRDRHELLRQVSDEEPPTLRSLVPNIPENLETIVLKSLRKESGDRYATAQELADDLHRFLDRRPILARPPRLAERFWSWTRRHPAVLLTSAITLVGVTVGSIITAVLVDTERERTRRAQSDAEQALFAERERAEEAESRLLLAQRAVDELIRVSDEELADRPSMILIRKRVLRAALTFYQELLVERRDEPRVHSELLKTAARVEQILADLEVLRSATQFYLLSHAVVLKDLGITEDQEGPLQDLTAQVGRDWMASFRDAGRISPSERTRQTLERARASETTLSSLLTESQLTRLRQIFLQSEGAAAFRDPEVAAAVSLSVGQREQIRQIEDETAFRWARNSRRMPQARRSDASDDVWTQQSISQAPASRRSSEYKEPAVADAPATADLDRESDSEMLSRARWGSVDQRILAILSDEQIVRWRKLTGAPLSGLTFPFAPTWPDNRVRNASTSTGESTP